MGFIGRLREMRYRGADVGEVMIDGTAFWARFAPASYSPRTYITHFAITYTNSGIPVNARTNLRRINDTENIARSLSIVSIRPIAIHTNQLPPKPNLSVGFSKRNRPPPQKHAIGQNQLTGCSSLFDPIMTTANREF